MHAGHGRHLEQVVVVGLGGAGHGDDRQVVEAFDRAYDLSSWHGPNLRGALRGVTAEEALWRPKPGAQAATPDRRIHPA